MSRSKDQEPASERALKLLSGEFDLESIIHIDLSNKGLWSLGCLPQCTQLRVLCLSHNQLKSVCGLVTLTVLEELDVSANQISNLDGLDKLECLQKLNIAGNMIVNVESLSPLSGLSNLIYLNLCVSSGRGDTPLSNPVCDLTSYELFMRKTFPNLLWHDGMALKGQGSDFHTTYRHLIETNQPDSNCLKQEPHQSKQQEFCELFAPLPGNQNDDKLIHKFDGLLLECSGQSQDISREIELLRTKLNGT